MHISLNMFVHILSAGVTFGAILAIGLFLFVVVLARKYRQRHPRGPEQNNAAQSNNIYSIFNPNRDSDYVNVKVPYLPSYTPPTNPPSYDDIGHYEELGGPNNEEPPIYEEIDNKRDTHVYENLEGGGYVNTGYKKDSHEMDYMKIWHPQYADHSDIFIWQLPCTVGW